MEASETIEQAEPQGSAALDQATSTSATGGTGEAPPVSFGTLFRQRVEERAARTGRRADASSADRETSAVREQPAPSTDDAPGPGADSTAGDGADIRPRSTRAERKAQKSGQATEPSGAAATEASGAAAPESPAADAAPNPVLERLERIEQRLTPRPEAGAPAPEVVAYHERFGDDTEFSRRAEIALHGSQRGQYLDASEQDELAVWASNRQTRDHVAGQYQQSFSAMTLAAAEAFGVPKETVAKPGTTFRDIFGAFVAQGEAKAAAVVAERDKKIADLETANRHLADENEGLLKRLPGTARSVLGGGQSATSRAAALADRSHMNGRQLMAAGIAQQGQGRRGRPGAR